MKFNYRHSFPTGVCLACSVFIINLLPSTGLVFPELINSGHALVFFFANLFLLKLILGQSNEAKYVLAISLCSMLIGIMIELIQPYFGRNRSLLDAAYDLVGVIFSALIFTRNRTASLKLKTLLVLGFLLIASAIPLFKLWLWWKINQSPIILNFERSWEQQIYSIDHQSYFERVNKTIDHSEKNTMGKLSVDFINAYLGINLNYPKHDWHQYSKLSWEVFSEDDVPINFNLRVHDSAHDNTYEDRFNYRFKVMPGMNNYEVSLDDIKHAPQSRQMNMRSISALKFFFSHPIKEMSLYLDNIRLE